MKKVFLLILAVFVLSTRPVFSDDDGMGRPPEEIKDMNPGSMHGSVPPNQSKPETAKPKPAEPVKPKPAESEKPKPAEPIHRGDEYGRPAHEDAARDQNDPSYHVILSNMLGGNLSVPQTPQAPSPPPAQDPVKPMTTPVADDRSAMKASFSETSGLDMEQEPIDYRTGNEDMMMRKVPGVQKNPMINQKRTPSSFESADALKGSVGQAPNARNMNGMKEEVASAKMRD